MGHRGVWARLPWSGWSVAPPTVSDIAGLPDVYYKLLKYIGISLHFAVNLEQIEEREKRTLEIWTQIQPFPPPGRNFLTTSLYCYGIKPTVSSETTDNLQSLWRPFTYIWQQPYLPAAHTTDQSKVLWCQIFRDLLPLRTLADHKYCKLQYEIETETLQMCILWNQTISLWKASTEFV